MKYTPIPGMPENALCLVNMKAPGRDIRIIERNVANNMCAIDYEEITLVTWYSGTGVVRSSGRASTRYRMPVSMDISSRTVSPLRIVTVSGSSRLPPTPWCWISTTYAPGFRATR
jgi:hypothetical protein